MLVTKLNKTLELIARLDQADIKNIEPLFHPFDKTQPLREDQITETNQRDLFQQGAPLTKAGLYLVPQVIETEE